MRRSFLIASAAISLIGRVHSFSPTRRSTCAVQTSVIGRRKISQTTSPLVLRERYDDEYDDEYDDDEYDDYDRRPPRPRRQRLRDDLGEFEDGVQDSGMDIPSAFGRRKGWRLPESVSKALLFSVFLVGIGLGVIMDSAINTDERDLASRDAIDQAAPNAQLCAQYGASAMAFDQRVFVSFNPFNVYVSQADVKPACVLKSSNVVPVLRERKLINDAEVRSCKQNMNTWAFVGDLDKEYPQISCVYKSDDAQNEFLTSEPKLGVGEDVWDDDRAASSPSRK
mmetsp:Transcript_51438/g.76796  ORF Transcript_51438/g.76796 Transcript_51438/m.76796 type:complete len:281 (-) Transcript_51438:3-845(-)